MARVSRDHHLSPAEAAKRFGVSIKALRLYEQRGLLTPARTRNGSSGSAWRVYGPDQIARLHQILTLKRLGLPLARIGQLLDGADRLAPVLALQEQVLAAEGARVAHALALVKAARAKLESGQALSIDDLATLNQETVMTAKISQDDIKNLMAPITAKYFTPEESEALQTRKRELFNTHAIIIAEARILMARGANATDPAALKLAQRWRDYLQILTAGGDTINARLRAAMRDAMADPGTAARFRASMPDYSAEHAFLKNARAHLDQ